MNRRITSLIITVIIVALIGAVAFTLTRKASQNDMGNMSHGDRPSTSESATYKQYASLKGEAYDRMFLGGMIAHHRGAVDMAKLALNQTKHSGLRTMAQSIITAQDQEINNMISWQAQWGYPATSGDKMMDHSAMGMENDMEAAINQLKNLTGEDFDKKFLGLMIEHHQSGIDMARPGASNAQHQRVKDFTKTAVIVQSQEINRMRAWQDDWGYKSGPRATISVP